jgi:hypothetical protein
MIHFERFTVFMLPALPEVMTHLVVSLILLSPFCKEKESVGR